MDIVWVLAVVALVLLLLTIGYIFLTWKIVDIRQTGSWAVVTGATDGIGKCFTHELAKLEMNIVLVSRNTFKLETCSKEIQETFKVSTKTIQADFASSDEGMYSRIKQELSGLDIGVLVNNVGMTQGHPDQYHVIDERHADTFQDIINCNITSAVNMTRFVLSGMVQRKRGLIINISSVLAQIPSPFNGVYGATKSFIAKFSTDLDREYRSQGVHIHLLRTGLVATKLSGADGVFGLVPNPKTYVHGAIRQVARSRDCDGYFGHWLTRIICLLLWGIIPFVADPIEKYLILRGRKKQIDTCEVCSNDSGNNI